MAGGLVAHTLHEQRDLNNAALLFEHLPHAKSDPEMVQLAVQLIDRQTSRYDAADLEDRYETRQRAMIEAKVQGEAIHEEAPAAPTSNVIDLMAALRKSLGEAPKAAERAPATPAAKRAQKAVEEQRKQPGLKLPIEGGGKKVKEAAEFVVAPARRIRRRAS
ncbi:MAG: hypothetical protein NVSMB18_33980 [Acetobacteraceae bacterium]